MDHSHLRYDWPHVNATIAVRVDLVGLTLFNALYLSSGVPKLVALAGIAAEHGRLSLSISFVLSFHLLRSPDSSALIVSRFLALYGDHPSSRPGLSYSLQPETAEELSKKSDL